MARRVIDVAAASIALLALAPLLGLVALAIVATSGRPVLFRQQRPGLHGRNFRILKFRTMRPARYEGEPDPYRLDTLGRLLRRWSVDELPQLWNVLRGDMSIIGPRPTLPEQVEQYGAWERRRLEVRPGITGYAQVLGRNSLSWPERIELDIWYIDNRSLWLDLRILARTVVALFRREGITGANGVNPGFPGPTPDAPDLDSASAGEQERQGAPVRRRTTA
ncbi:MAG: sugar transferase [Nitriliruptorales bacterium]|nr:sugar transferase [Nitriliruptorales bacterium]